jgi:hypothetical protein
MPTTAEKDELRKFAKPDGMRAFQWLAKLERRLNNLEGLVVR